MLPFDLNKPLFALTIGEFIKLNESIQSENQKLPQKTGLNEDQIITSIKGLARFIHCSVPTAQKFKNRFPGIFHQTGRKFLVSKSDILSKMK
jgi:hypothetical protein